MLAQLSFDQPDEIESALKNLQRYQYKNNGILIIKDLSKLKTGLLRIFENQKNFLEKVRNSQIVLNNKVHFFY